MSDSIDNPGKSKSQVKRELLALQTMGKELLNLSEELIDSITDERLREALRTGQRLRPGPAAKRHRQYVGKLLRSLDLTELEQLLARVDGRSKDRDFHFHRLERWRQALMEGDADVLGEIIQTCPDADVTNLRQLARAASHEAATKPESKQHSRKLFRELRALVEREHPNPEQVGPEPK